jgi:GNAT superfamily N-acetyltransferase
VTDFRRPEPISPEHDVAEFDCGSDAQTIWLRDHALQAARADSSRVYVSCVSGTNLVGGYYRLAAGVVARESAPPRITHGLGRYPVPVVILTRLGVDRRHQGQGLGRSLVHDALLQTASVADRVGVRALLIHAATPEAAALYGRVSAAFVESPTDPLHLLLLMKDLRRAIREGAGPMNSSLRSSSSA